LVLCGSAPKKQARPKKPRPILAAGLVASISLCWLAGACGQVDLWLTDPDKSVLFQKQNPSLSFSNPTNPHPVIAVDETQSFQTIDGFGCCLTGGSAMLLLRMSAPARAALLKELFADDAANIGLSYLRLSLGASDLNDHVFSYDDLPPGQTDPGMAKFSLDPDRADVIPVLREILAINPELKLLASPWSPPPWMKTNHDSRGGSLKPEFYPAYAKYFVRYILGLRAEGIRIDAITVQNEPLHPGNNPSLFMPAPEQAAFIKLHLGPAFRAAAIDTRIIVYDHNADRPDYPLAILNDPAARQYVDGSAFHLYAGAIETLTQVHDAYPDKNLYFTEQWVGAPGHLKGDLDWHVKHLVIGASRNWCRTVLEWNLAADPNHDPHTDRGGCDRCLGALTLAGDQVTRNPAYYILAHAAKFVRPGSVRIASAGPQTLPNVAFKTPGARSVLIVLNDSQAPQTFNVRYRRHLATSALNPGAVGTYVW
jgi:glucosylceramidase